MSQLGKQPQIRSRAVVAAALGSIPFGVATYIVSCLAVMEAVPRHSEGVRECVSIPWPVYASLPWVVAAVASVALTFLLLRDARARLASILTLLVTIAGCNAVAIELLRRDFVGKF